MRRDAVIEALRRFEPEIRARGATALYLFGSTARDEATEESDIDLYVESHPTAPLDWHDVVELEGFLARELGRRIDLTLRERLRPELAPAIVAGALPVFGAPMPPPELWPRGPVTKNPLPVLRDIKRAITVATQTLARPDFGSDANVFAVRYAVLQVSEASRRLPADLKGDYPLIPWRQIADIGNILRHAYDSVDDAILRGVVETDMPHLEQVIDDMIARTAGEKE